MTNFEGLNLMDSDLGKNLPVYLYKKEAPKRNSYFDGFQSALSNLLCGKNNGEILQMEEDKPDRVDLDDPLVWRQKKVKEKAIYFFEILLGKKVNSKLLRIGFDELSTKGYLRKFPERNMYKRFLAEGYTEGTANSQAGQMHSLFTQLRVVIPDPTDPNKYIVNPKSLLYKKALKAFKEK